MYLCRKFVSPNNQYLGNKKPRLFSMQIWQTSWHLGNKNIFQVFVTEFNMKKSTDLTMWTELCARLLLSLVWCYFYYLSMRKEVRPAIQNSFSTILQRDSSFNQLLQPHKNPIKISDTTVSSGESALDLSVMKELSSWLVQLLITGYMLWIQFAEHSESCVLQAQTRPYR